MGLYEVERDKISRTPQFIVTLAVTSCDNSYASIVPPSTCTAADAGNGSRCYYSFGTCQDVAHFRIDTSGLKLFKFCLKDAPLPVGGADIWPMLKSVVISPQKIDPEKAVTISERIKLEFYDDAARWNLNQDKASAGALTNTGTPQGTFWRRFMRIYRNYANPRNYVTVNVGFVAAGAVESDFKQRGKYLIDNLQINGDGIVTMTLTDRLKLLKTKCPAKISQGNLLNGSITNAALTGIVDDGSELTVPGAGFTVTIQIADDSAFTTNVEYLNVSGVAGNVLTWTRGRWGTTAISHQDNSYWREVVMAGTERSTPSLAPLGINIIDAAVSLLQRGGIAAADIDTATLNQERDDWLPSQIDATLGTQTGVVVQRAGGAPDAGNGGIAIQTDVETLIRQLREIGPLSLFVGEDQKVTGRVFAPARPSVTLTELTDNENIIKDSIEIDDNEISRANIIVIGYDLIAGKDGTQLAHYNQIVSRADANGIAVGNYGSTAIRVKTILNPWIPNSVAGASIAGKLAVHLLGRYRNPARKIGIDLEVKDDAVKCGDFVYLSTERFQKPDGSTDLQRIVECQSKGRDPRTHVLSLGLQDSGLINRYGFISPAGTPVYNSASVNQRRYGFIGRAADNKVGTLLDDGYRIW